MPASKSVITYESIFVYPQGIDFPKKKHIHDSIRYENKRWRSAFHHESKDWSLGCTDHFPFHKNLSDQQQWNPPHFLRPCASPGPLYTAIAISSSWSKSTEMSGNLLTRRSLFFPYWITCSNNKNWAWLCSIVYGGESGTSAAAGGNVHLLYWRRVWDLTYSSSALQIVRGLLVRVIVT